jgi:hypothetical protein
MRTVAAAGLVGYEKGLFEIRDILRAGISIPDKIGRLSNCIAGFPFDHPFATAIGVGGILFAGGTAWAMSDSLYMPKTLGGLARVQDGVYVSYDAGRKQPANRTSTPTLSPADAAAKAAAVNTGLGVIAEKLQELQDIGDNITDWTKKQIERLPERMMNDLPELAAQRPQEAAAERSGELLDSFLDDLRARETEATIHADPQNSADKKSQPATIHEAIVALEQYKTSLAAAQAENGDRVQCVKDYEAARAALAVIGFTLSIEDGIVRWEDDKENSGDLCIDPSVSDPEQMLDLSRETRGGGEGAPEYFFFRSILDLRTKSQDLMDRGEWMEENMIPFQIPGGKIAAMIIGSMVYWVSGDHLGEYCCAPVTLIRSFFGNDSWSEFAAKLGERTTTAAIITAPVGLAAMTKRAVMGGDNIISVRSWKGLFGKINPITSTINLVRDAARGVVDFSVWRNFNSTPELSGLLANILTGKSGIRPDWIGFFDECKDTPQDMKKLQHIARQMGLNSDGNYSVLKNKVGTKITDELKRVERLLSKDGIGQGMDYARLREKIIEWYKTDRKISRKFEQLAKAGEITKDLPFALVRTISGQIGKVKKVEQLILDGSKISDLYKQGHTIKTLYSAGASAADLIALPGVQLKDLTRILSVDDLIGTTIGGRIVTISSLIAEGMRAEKFLDSSLDMGQILSAMRTAGQLDKLVAAANPAQLKAMIDAKATLQELVAAKASFKALIDVGQSLDDIAAVVAKAGSDAKAVQQLIKLGMTEAQFLAQGGKVVDFARAAIQVERARKLATAGKIAGKGFIIGGAVLDSGIAAFVDIPELQRRMDETKDAQARLDLQRQIRDKEKGIGVNAVLATGSVAPNPFMPIFWGASAAKAFVVDPLSGSTNAATDYMLQTTDSMESKTPGANLADVGQSAPGTMVSWGQRLTTFQIDAQHQANTGVRRNAYEAYFRSMVPFNIRPIGKNDDRLPENLRRIEEDPDLIEEIRKQKITERQKLLRQLNDDMRRLFVTQAWQYLSFATQGTFVSVDHTVLERAASYARLAVEEERQFILHPEGYERKLPLYTDTFTAGGPSAKERVTERIEENVTAELGARTTAGCNKLKEMTNPEERKETVSNIILDALIHDLSVLEGKILLSNSARWFRGAAWKHLSTSADEFRAMVRGRFVDEIITAVKGALSKPTFTAADLAKTLETVRKKIGEKDLDEVGAEVASSDDAERLLKLGEQPDSLTVLKLQERIFAAPETPAQVTLPPPTAREIMQKGIIPAINPKI